MAVRVKNLVDSVFDTTKEVFSSFESKIAPRLDVDRKKLDVINVNIVTTVVGWKIDLKVVVSEFVDSKRFSAVRV